MKKMILSSLGIFLVSGLFLGIIADAAEKPKYGGILTNIAYPRAPKKMGEPAKIWGVDSGYSMMMIEGLVRATVKEDGSCEYKPVLATSWKQLPDGRSWEFQIRKVV